MELSSRQVRRWLGEVRQWLHMLLLRRGPSFLARAPGTVLLAAEFHDLLQNGTNYVLELANADGALWQAVAAFPGPVRADAELEDAFLTRFPVLGANLPALPVIRGVRPGRVTIAPCGPPSRVGSWHAGGRGAAHPGSLRPGLRLVRLGGPGSPRSTAASWHSGCTPGHSASRSQLAPVCPS